MTDYLAKRDDPVRFAEMDTVTSETFRAHRRIWNNRLMPAQNWHWFVSHRAPDNQ
jgi:hypothetical protein